MISPVVATVPIACLLFLSFAYSQTVATIQDGSWHDPTTWAGGTTPGLSADVVIHHHVTLAEGVSAQVLSISVAGHLVLDSGSVLQLSGGSGGRTLLVTGVLECADGSALHGTSSLSALFDAGSRYIHRQGPLGFIPLATWHKESTLQISGFVDSGYINLAHSNSWRQPFGNVEYDCPGQTVFIVDLNGHLRDIRGNLTIRDTNNKALRLSTTQQTTISIAGSLTIEGRSQVWFTTNSTNCTINIAGDFHYRSQATAASYLATRGNVRLVIGGDWVIDAQSALRMASSAADSTGSRQATVLLAGDFRVSRGSLIAPPAGRGTGRIEFNGVSPQQVDISRIATPLSGNLVYHISGSSRVNLGESVLISELGALEVFGSLGLGSTDGSGAIQAGNGGNIGIPGVRTFASGSTIIYNGTAQQTIGDGHPRVPHLIFDNPAGLRQISHVETDGSFTLVRGLFNQSGHALTVGGDVIVAAGIVNLEHLRLSGAVNQLLDIRAGTIGDLDIGKTAGAVELISPLALTRRLQIASTNTEFRSNGFLTLLSTGDEADHTASIGALPAGSRITGDVTVQRFMSGEGRLYRYLSSPITNATVASLMDDFSVTGNFADPSEGPGIASGSPSLFSYDESMGNGAHGWIGYPNGGVAAAALLNPGRGYAAFVRNRSSTVLDFTGPVNQGEIHLPLSYSAHNGVGNGWHLVGNPYPAAIDWDASAIAKTRVSNVIAIRDNGDRRFRYWDGDGQYTEVPEGRIALGQSFWVRATSAGATLTFHEEAKASDASFYRRPRESIPSICISVSDDHFADHAILKLRTHSSNSLDNWDGVKLFNDTLNLAIVDETGTSLAIDCRPVLPDSVNLRLTELQPARYVLRLSAQDSLRQQTYYVKDRFLTRTVKLSVQESLEFLVTDDTASSAPDRFTLFFQAPLNEAAMPLSPSDVPGNRSEADSTSAGTTFHLNTLVFYPNPVSTELLVDGACHKSEVCSDPGKMQVELFDAVGTPVSPHTFTIRFEVRKQARRHLFVINVEKLPSGAYFMKVNNNLCTGWGRFIKT